MSEPHPVDNSTGLAPADVASLELSPRGFAAGKTWFDPLAQTDAPMAVCTRRG